MRRITGSWSEPPGILHTVMVRAGTGSRVDREVEIQFKNMQLIGNGTFGTVYMAIFRENEEPIAIKKILVDNRYKGRIKKRSLTRSRELTILRHIEHPNITRLLYYYYSNQNQDQCYLNLIMEFMPKNLFTIHRQYVHTEKAMPSVLIKLYAFQLLRGIGFLHLNNIMHRDIKPKNLLIEEKRGVLKICDFGSAKIMVKNEPNINYICSRYYRAPELIFGSRNYDSSIDIWSCGTVIAELMHTTAIFTGDNAIDILVLQMKALGTPTREEMRKFNYQFANIPFENFPGTGIQQLINKKLSLKTLELLNSLLQMDPTRRIKPYKALTLEFFDEIRNSNYQHAHDIQRPSLFDWLEKEYTANSDIMNCILPKNDAQ